jgi:hypothetical protein
MPAQNQDLTKSVNLCHYRRKRDAAPGSRERSSAREIACFAARRARGAEKRVKKMSAGVDFGG